MNPLGVKGQSTDLKFLHMLKYDVAMPYTNFGTKIFAAVCNNIVGEVSREC